MQRLRVKAPMHIRFRKAIESPTTAGCNSGEELMVTMVGEIQRLNSMEELYFELLG
jgi:hypothetical protein